MLTHRQKVLRRYGLTDADHPSLSDLARLSGYPERVLQEVYNRGVGAWKTNIASVRLLGSFKKDPNLSRYPRSARLPKEMWAMARVYSFLDGGRTFFTADSDLAFKIRRA
jgi:hypothetical protein